MTPEYADANDLKIAYEGFGSPSDPTVLLVMGLGAQMISWPDEMCSAIAARGYRVVRFDNRDVGLSTHLTGVPTPPMADLILRRRPPPYTLEDMADDTVGLLDVLDVESAHVVGASLGGFIAQTVAVRHPKRGRSLTLFMTSTGSRFVGLPKPSIFQLGRLRQPTSREEAIETTRRVFRVIGSPGYPIDEERLRELAGRGWDRDPDRSGLARQLAAVIVQPDRTRQLARVAVPTTVVHGLADPLVNPSGGLAIARAVPGSRFVGYAGMGHDLPAALWPRFVEDICSSAAAGDSQASAG
jgi:pimeloyl-ACP methyl ester carboxylesterase